jgi:uncharacterized protein (DUF2384 family)
MGTNLIKHIDGNKSTKLDIIPNDFVSHLMIVLAARNSQFKAETINLSTSTRNHITLKDFLETGRQAWEEYGENVGKIEVT